MQMKQLESNSQFEQHAQSFHNLTGISVRKKNGAKL